MSGEERCCGGVGRREAPKDNVVGSWHRLNPTLNLALWDNDPFLR